MESIYTLEHDPATGNIRLLDPDGVEVEGWNLVSYSEVGQVLTLTVRCVRIETPARQVRVENAVTK